MKERFRFRWVPGGVAALLIIGAWYAVRMLVQHPESLLSHESD